MKAQLIIRFKDVTPEGGVIELVVWRVPEPARPSEHGFKYRAAYVVDGVRVVGFDNERGKGDHCHVRGTERPYTFVSVEQLIEVSLLPSMRRGTRDDQANADDHDER
jgi:hypothetical protein